MHVEDDLSAFGVRCLIPGSAKPASSKRGWWKSTSSTSKKNGYVPEKDYDGATWFVAPGEEDKEKDKDRVLRTQRRALDVFCDGHCLSCG